MEEEKMAAIIKYSKSVYEQKISKMEAYAKELQVHLTTLESLKNQVRNFWDDEQGSRYLSAITDQILKVRDSLDQISSLRATYSDILAELTNSSSMIDGVIEDVTSAVGNVIGLV